jgi:hypothetical protein
MARSAVAVANAFGPVHDQGMRDLTCLRQRQLQLRLLLMEAIIALIVGPLRRHG